MKYIFNIFYLGLITIFNFILNIIKYFLIGLYNAITLIPRYFIIGIKSILGKKKKESKENKKLSFAIAVLSFTVYLACVFFVSRWYVQGLKLKYLSNTILENTEVVEKEETIENVIEEPPQEETPQEESNNNVYYPNDYWDYMNVPFMNVNFEQLLAKNPDTVGWIKIDGTKVNYPVVQASDNDYYLHHAFNKSANAGGWIFADYRVDFENFGKNTIIYGHNMNNKTMFGSVPHMLYDSYLKNSSNSYIKISTPTSNTVWKVFSIYTTEPNTYYLKTNFKTYSYEEFLNTIKGRSIYNFGIDVTPDDKILTLSTCDNTGTKRVAVHSKMISIEYK